MSRRHRPGTIWIKDLSDILKTKDLNESNSPWYVLHPDTLILNIWSKLMISVLMYTGIITPFRIAFVDNDDYTWSLIEYFIYVLCFIDLIINCVSAYYDNEKVLITDPKKILLRYLVTWMIPDLIACIPFSAILNQDKNYSLITKITRLPRLYRLIKIAKLVGVIKIMKSRSNVLSHIKIFLNLSDRFEKLFWFFFTYVLLMHLICCAWVFVGRINTTSINWIYAGGYEDLSNTYLYIVSMYWTITTTSTVGYGDVVAVNFYEKLTSCIVMTTGIIIYSYTVSSLTNFISGSDLKKSRLAQKLIILDEIATKCKMSPEFYQKITKALGFVSTNTKDEVNEILQDLPATLANQLILIMYEKKLMNNNFFEGKSTDFVAWVARRLIFFKTVSDTFIYSEGEYANEMYFLTAGKVEYLYIEGKDEISYLELSSGYYFGEVDLLFSTDKNRLHTVKSTDNCELLILNKENFFVLLDTFQEIGIEICLAAKERYKRLESKVNEVKFNYKNRLPIIKKRSFPEVNLSDFENQSNRINSNLFTKLIRSKYKYKEKKIKAILREVKTIETQAESLKEIVEVVKEKMKAKFPQFILKEYK
jgi:CRP-like cAMP-binding protein